MARRKDAISSGQTTLSRQQPLRSAAHAALLVIDVQYYVAAPGYGENADFDANSIPADKQYFFERLRNVTLPNIKKIQEACRALGMEVMFTNVESLTQDGRDRGLDYKISGFHVPRGSKEAQTLAEIAPQADEITINKTSSSVFNSTNIDYVLRALEVDYLVIVGLLTDQCVESAVRDACDLGYLVTVVDDACVTYSQERHDYALSAYQGYCRTVCTDALVKEIQSIAGR